MDKILAIVGSTKFAEDKLAHAVATNFITYYVELVRPTIIVSGGAIGIDTIADTIAKKMNIVMETFHPTNKRWEPEGFKERNVKIAEFCTWLISIRHFNSKTYGSGWTADYAEIIGRPVQRFMFQPNGEIELL